MEYKVVDLLSIRYGAAPEELVKQHVVGLREFVSKFVKLCVISSSLFLNHYNNMYIFIPLYIYRVIELRLDKEG